LLKLSSKFQSAGRRLLRQKLREQPNRGSSQRLPFFTAATMTAFGRRSAVEAHGPVEAIARPCDRYCDQKTIGTKQMK
jgi:hypothetical protein